MLIVEYAENSRGKSVDYMAPKRKECPYMGEEESPSEGEEIPKGWNVKSEVQNDGSIKMVLKNLL